MKKDDDFKISKRVRAKLKDRAALRKELAAGKSAQDILGFSDQTVNKLYHAAHQLLEHQRYTDAANAFVFLVTLNPYRPHYWMGLGASLQFCHEYESAIDAYEMAALYKVEDPLPYFYLAKCLFAIHDRRSALQAIDLAIEYAEDKDEYAELKLDAIRAKKVLLNS